MSHSLQASHRHPVRRALAFGIPLVALVAFLGYAQAKPGDGPLSYVFSATPAPTLATPANMASTYTTSSLTKVRKKGSETCDLVYRTLFLTGDVVPKTGGGTIVAGSYFDNSGAPILDATSADLHQFYSDCPDGMSLLQLWGGRSKRRGCNRLFAVVQFEYTSRNAAGDDMYGKLPSPIAVLTLDQDRRTGQLGLVSYYNVDTSPARGLWITCAASMSPWGTHLSSEEYEPDATLASNPQLEAFSTDQFGDPSTANPYDYGHIPEVTVYPDGTASIVKHYCMGRISHEVVQVLPDERTVLMGDDATNGGLFMFVADHKRNLSAGTLYAAKWTQTSGTGPGAGDLSWIRLGHATSAEIKALVDGGITAADIMDVKTSDPSDARYTHIRYSGHDNWVKLMPGMEKAAAFLETHRYAALVGASLGFTKMEGVTVNGADRRAYVAMSYIYKSMTDGTTDIDVEGPVAGAVYELVLQGGQKDLDGSSIHSPWVPTSMSAPASLVGEDLAVRDALGNSANPGKIANPDNLKYSERMRTLFVGEDSGNHVNNFLWAWNVDTGELSRILSVPSGAECTGLQPVDNANGFSYVLSNFQHPGDWESPLHDVVKSTLEPLENANYNDRTSGAVGYLLPDCGCECGHGAKGSEGRGH
jgi:hypothetical protein